MPKACRSVDWRRRVLSAGGGRSRRRTEQHPRVPRIIRRHFIRAPCSCSASTRRWPRGVASAVFVALQLGFVRCCFFIVIVFPASTSRWQGSEITRSMTISTWSSLARRRPAWLARPSSASRGVRRRAHRTSSQSREWIPARTTAAWCTQGSIIRRLPEGATVRRGRRAPV